MCEERPSRPTRQALLEWKADCSPSPSLCTRHTKVRRTACQSCNVSSALQQLLADAEPSKSLTSYSARCLTWPPQEGCHPQPQNSVGQSCKRASTPCHSTPKYSIGKQTAHSPRTTKPAHLLGLCILRKNLTIVHVHYAALSILEQEFVPLVAIALVHVQVDDEGAADQAA